MFKCLTKEVISSETLFIFEFLPFQLSRDLIYGSSKIGSSSLYGKSRDSDVLVQVRSSVEYVKTKNGRGKVVKLQERILH